MAGVMDWSTSLLFGDDYGASDANKVIDSANNVMTTYSNEALKNIGNADEYYKAGRSAAGKAANDKAGIAKKQAKAAAAMNNGSKMTQAIAGADAANKAVTEGFDTTSNNMANLEAGSKQAKANTLLNTGKSISDNVTKQAQNIMTEKQNKQNAKQNTWSNIASTIASFMK